LQNGTIRLTAVNELFNASMVILAGIAGRQSPAQAGFCRRLFDQGSAMAVDLSMPVLVVDDYSTMIRIIRNLLKQLGFENIDDASDGSAALNKMRGKRYGLVISDWNMEPMTGYDLLREVRADPNLATTPFIMITAESKTENVIAAKKAGVNNYIVKPFNAATLKTKIEAVFPDMASA
jgi:two-component system chemotaxis response regulator CheY